MSVMPNPFRMADKDERHRVIESYLILGIVLVHDFDNIDEVVEYTGWARARVTMALDLLEATGVIGVDGTHATIN